MNKQKNWSEILNELKTYLKAPELNSAFGAIEKVLMNKSATVVQGKSINIYSDGACRGNPGPGSWACFARNEEGEVLFEKTGVETPTTNNKMEMQGVIQGLYGIKDMSLEGQSIEFFTDSKYVINGITEWMANWKKRGWKKADKKTPENVDLWKELDVLVSSFNDLKMSWVKGHSGHPENERCDEMANHALDDAGF